MPTLFLSIASPKFRIIEKPNTVWIFWGMDRSAAERFDEQDDPKDDLASQLCRQVGDATVVKVIAQHGRATEVKAWKGLTSCYELFYSVRPNGDLLLSDQFRNILSALPVCDRYPSTDSIVDYFLFNTVPGTGSYSRNVLRLGQGEQLTFDLAAQNARTSLFDEIGDCATNRPIEKHLEKIDRALSAALNPLKGEAGTVNLFSGGTDSTLIQSYLGHKVPVIHMVLESLQRDSPHETIYGPRAAGMMAVKPEIHLVREADYPAQLDELIEALATPPTFHTMVFFREAFRQDHKKYVTGDLGDSLFGSSGRYAKVASFFSSPLGLLLIHGVARCLPASARPGWHQLAPSAEAFSRDPTSPYGYGAGRSVFTEYPLLDLIFSRDAVRGRLASRLDYVLQRVRLSAANHQNFHRHFEIAQWINYLCTDHVMHLRQLAHAHGKTVFAPFLARAVLESALAVPVTKRYMQGLRTKYLLKLLLERRVPGYPVDQRKGYSAVSFERYFRSGPLCNIWERYRIPDFIDSALHQRIINCPGEITWHALTYAIWEERVVKNVDLRPVPNSSMQSWEY